MSLEMTNLCLQGYHLITMTIMTLYTVLYRIMRAELLHIFSAIKLIVLFGFHAMYPLGLFSYLLDRPCDARGLLSLQGKGSQRPPHLLQPYPPSHIPPPPYKRASCMQKATNKVVFIACITVIADSTLKWCFCLPAAEKSYAISCGMCSSTLLVEPRNLR